MVSKDTGHYNGWDSARDIAPMGVLYSGRSFSLYVCTRQSCNGQFKLICSAHAVSREQDGINFLNVSNFRIKCGYKRHQLHGKLGSNIRRVG